jgi:AraC family transcriptional regulator
VAVAFTWQPNAVVEIGGSRPREREVSPNTVGLCGKEPISWLSVDLPSDLVEITAAPGLRREMAEELGVARHADLDDLFNWADPVLLAIARRFRAGLRGWTHISELERDELVRAAYGRALIAKFGGQFRRGGGALDEARLRRVTDLVEARSDGALTIAELAGVAALSAFHFARSFRQATGLTPHQFVTSWRLQRAAEQLRQMGATVEQAAHSAGFSNQGHFRRAFKAQFGVSPGQLRPKEQESTCRRRQA